MFHHVPVLLEQTLDIIRQIPVNPVRGYRRIVDATVGGGGHASAILEQLPDAQLLGLDRDSHAIEAASERLAPFGNRFTLMHTTFSNLETAVHQHGWDYVDGILMDIGVSSAQIDTPDRGFSFRFDGPLDMRMNQDDTTTAADILNQASEKELADIFYLYGEEQKARKVAAEVVKRRASQPWETTADFAAMLEKVVGRAHQHGLPPATRCFQALRIAVNHELDELEAALKQAVNIIDTGGRLVVISFHSLEDRIAKNFLRQEAASCICPPGLPICTCHKIQTITVLTSKPVTATAVELAVNPRAACAKLRAATIINHINAVREEA